MSYLTTPLRTVVPKKEKPGSDELLFSLLWLIPASIIRGFVLSKLWLWFVASTFHIHTLSIATAIGISLIFTMLLPTNSSKNIHYGIEWMLGVALTSIASPMFILFLGWMVHHFQ